MGGRGSGRHWHWDAKSTTTDYLRLDVRRWARDGLLSPGHTFGWHWSRDGEKVASINVDVGYNQVRLRYRSSNAGGEAEAMNYAVRLLSQQCHLGGTRQWFECPARGCGKRVALLYGGRVFACRDCHDLAYPSQRERKYMRHVRKADKIRERLGWEVGFDASYGCKPKHMHWRTFFALMDKLERQEEASNLAFIEHFKELL